MVPPQSHDFLRLYQHYKHGYLPGAGGVLDQPNKYLEAMEIIGATVYRIEQDELDRMEREAKRNAHLD